MTTTETAAVKATLNRKQRSRLIKAQRDAEARKRHDPLAFPKPCSRSKYVPHVGKKQLKKMESVK